MNMNVEVVRDLLWVRVVRFPGGLLSLHGPALPVLIEVRYVSPQARDDQCKRREK